MCVIYLLSYTSRLRSYGEAVFGLKTLLVVTQLFVFTFVSAEITDIKFLCLNGTVFDQETRVCERLDEVDCSKSESFFDLNLELYGNNGAGYG